MEMDVEDEVIQTEQHHPSNQSPGDKSLLAYLEPQQVEGAAQQDTE